MKQLAEKFAYISSVKVCCHARQTAGRTNTTQEVDPSDTHGSKSISQVYLRGIKRHLLSILMGINSIY